MKKRTKKKLQLCRETLYELQGRNLRGIAGGTELTSVYCIDITFCDCETGGGCAPPTGILATCC